MKRLRDWLWFHMPVITTRGRYERRIWQNGKNSFDVGREWERLVQEGRVR